MFHLDENSIKEFEDLNLKSNCIREKSGMSLHWLLKTTERIKNMQNSVRTFLNGTCKEIFPPVTSTLNVC